MNPQQHSPQPIRLPRAGAARSPGPRPPGRRRSRPAHQHLARQLAGMGALLLLGLLLVAPSPAAAGAIDTSLGYCTANSLPATDDGSSPQVTLPFSPVFFGATYSSVFVNNNGNVTFDSGRSQYTPSDITGNTGRAMIAPFFADVDTRGTGQVTYGSAPDGRTFCASWSGVGYYSAATDRTNSFQLLITNRSATAGRSPGDFDITFNYDQIQWETGSAPASGGTNGLGGKSAVAGYTAGSGAAGTFFQFPGSLVNGALLDGGPNSLVAGRQNSSVSGRYVFQVNNNATQSLGSATGRVVMAGPTPVANTWVEACRVNTDDCLYTQTNAAGGFTFTAIPVGEYTFSGMPPAGSTMTRGFELGTVPTGATTTVPDIMLSAPSGIPADTTLTSIGTSSAGLPMLHWNRSSVITRTGCAGGVASYRILQGNRVLRAGPMAEGPPGTYTASIPPLYPNHGSARVETSLTCKPGDPPLLSTFDIYIDPSGTIVDQNNSPVAGATATLLRSDSAEGPFAVVPNGDPIMDPGNRLNPSTTGPDGRFGWDVIPGWYKVEATRAGCTSAHTEALPVPPPQLDLIIRITCAAPPSPPPAKTATAVSLTASPLAKLTLISKVTLTATISPAAATGTVTFADSGHNLGTAALTAGRAILVTADIYGGRQQLTATYSGDAAFTASTSATVGITITDRTKPKITKPRVTGRAAAPTASFRASDAGGVRVVLVKWRNSAPRRSKLGRWSAVTQVPGTARTATAPAVASRVKLCFAVKAVDFAGRTSKWRTKCRRLY